MTQYREELEWVGRVEKYIRRRKLADDIASVILGILILACIAIAWVVL